jgi:competence protein ComEC
MTIVYFLAPLLNRRADAQSTIASAALVILAVSPAQLREVGFIYSFVVVTGLVILYPSIEKPLRALWAADALRVQREPWIKRQWRAVRRYVVSLVAVSLSAWLVSAPLTIHFFGRFTPVALVSNIVVIPLAFCIVVAGCLSLVLGSCVGVMADIFNHANLALVVVLERTMGFMASIPWVSMDIGRGHPWIAVLWYAVLVAGTLWLRRRRSAKLGI